MLLVFRTSLSFSVPGSRVYPDDCGVVGRRRLPGCRSLTGGLTRNSGRRGLREMEGLFVYKVEVPFNVNNAKHLNPSRNVRNSVNFLGGVDPQSSVRTFLVPSNPSTECLGEKGLSVNPPRPHPTPRSVTKGNKSSSTS